MGRNFTPSSELVISIHKSYADLRSVAKVGSLFGKPKSTVHDILKKYDSETGQPFIPPQKRGRKRKTTPAQDDAIEEFVTGTRRVTAKKVLRHLRDVDLLGDVSRSLIGKRLQERKYRYVNSVKDGLTEDQKKRRVEWCNEHMGILERDLDFFYNVAFSDEARFSLDADGNIKIYVKEGENRYSPELQLKIPPPKRNGIMVFGAISPECPVCFARLCGRQDSFKYQATITQHVMPFLDNNAGFVWQEDNASIHKSHSTVEFFEERAITVLDWPPYSPDLSPIENVWSGMKRVLDQRMPKNLVELAQMLDEAWK